MTSKLGALSMASANLPYQSDSSMRATPYQTGGNASKRTLKSNTPVRAGQQAPSLATSAGGETATFLQFVRLCARAHLRTHGDCFILVHDFVARAVPHA